MHILSFYEDVEIKGTIPFYDDVPPISSTSSHFMMICRPFYAHPPILCAQFVQGHLVGFLKSRYDKLSVNQRCMKLM